MLKFKYVIFQEHFRIKVLVDLGTLKLSTFKLQQYGPNAEGMI